MRAWVMCFFTANKQLLRVFYNKSFFYIVCYIHRKTFMLEFVFNKVAGLQSGNLIKKRLQHRYFPVSSAKFLKTSFSQKTFRRLLLTAALLFCRSILMEERQQYCIHFFTDFIHKTFTPNIFRKYSKKQTSNMSILQF